MKIVVTGSPGTGKSTVSKLLGSIFGLEVINDSAFAKSSGSGACDHISKEFEVDMGKFSSRFGKYAKKMPGWIAEGHLFCEAKISPDIAIVLRTDTETLEKRLSTRNYTEEKIQDNIMCEGTAYCLRLAKKTFQKKCRVIEIDTTAGTKEALINILSHISGEGESR